jgi:hypothetical protein
MEPKGTILADDVAKFDKAQLQQHMADVQNVLILEHGPGAFTWRKRRDGSVVYELALGQHQAA